MWPFQRETDETTAALVRAFGTCFVAISISMHFCGQIDCSLNQKTFSQQLWRSPVTTQADTSGSASVGFPIPAAVLTSHIIR